MPISQNFQEFYVALDWIFNCTDKLSAENPQKSFLNQTQQDQKQ